MILVAPDNNDIIFEPVFGNAVFKQSILYHLKVRQQSTLIIEADATVLEHLKELIAVDPELSILGMTLRSKSAPTPDGADWLHRIYDSSNNPYTLYSRHDLKNARHSLKESIIKNCPTFVARHINKKLSLPLSGLLAQKNIHPNFISLVAILIGLLGGFLAVKMDFFWAVLCFQVNSLLDGCDGEVARLNVKQSAFGKKLDIYGDYLTSVVAIVGLSMGLMLAEPSSTAIHLLGKWSIGLLVSIGVLWVAAIFLKITPKNFENVEALCHQRLRSPQTWLERLAKAFLLPSQKDFYFLVMFVLALFGQSAMMALFLFFVSLAWAFLSFFTISILYEQNEK